MGVSDWIASIRTQLWYWNRIRKVRQFKLGISEALVQNVKPGKPVKPIQTKWGALLYLKNHEERLLVPEQDALLFCEIALLQVAPYPYQILDGYDWVPSAVTFPIDRKNSETALGFCCINQLLANWLKDDDGRLRLGSDPWKNQQIVYLIARAIVLHECGHIFRAREEDSWFQRHPDATCCDEREDLYADLVAVKNGGLSGLLIYLTATNLIFRMMYITNHIPNPVDVVFLIIRRIAALVLETLPGISNEGAQAVMEILKKLVSDALEKHAYELNDITDLLASGSKNLITGVYSTFATEALRKWPAEWRLIFSIAILRDQIVYDRKEGKQNPEIGQKYIEKFNEFKALHPEWFKGG